MAENLSTGVHVVSTLALEMRQSIIALSGPRGWVETRQRWLERGARAAGISYRTAKALFYCECGDPRASVVESVRSALAKHQEQEAKARAEFQRTRTLLETAIARLEQIDPDFHREQTAALREAVDRARQSQGVPGAGAGTVDCGGEP